MSQTWLAWKEWKHLCDLKVSLLRREEKLDVENCICRRWDLFPPPTRLITAQQVNYKTVSTVLYLKFPKALSPWKVELRYVSNRGHRTLIYALQQLEVFSARCWHAGPQYNFYKFQIP